jgi:hypothetical protein
MTKIKKFYKIDTRNGLIGAVRTLLNQSVGGFKVQTLDLLNLPQSSLVLYRSTGTTNDINDACKNASAVTTIA